MFGLVLNKISHGINLVQFKIGEVLFLFLEPFYQILENRDSEARKHFHQALKSLESRSLNVALLNLNMVLNLYPDHFLARIYRARVYVFGKQFQLAAKDYVLASQTSRFRFIHYDLYREYFISVNRDVGDMNVPLIKNFNQAYKIMRLRENPTQGFLDSDSQALGSQGDWEVYPIEDTVFAGKEQTEISELGPITRKEIEAVDWEILSKELSSKIREP